MSWLLHAFFLINILILELGIISKNQKVNFELNEKLMSFPAPNFLFLLAGILSILLFFLILYKPLKLFLAMYAGLFIGIVFFNFSVLGKTYHSVHILMWASILLIFFESNSKLSSKNNFLMIRLVQTYILSTYFCSGLWKFRNLFQIENWQKFIRLPTEHFANSVATGSEPNFIIMQFVHESYFSTFLFLGFLFVLVFQISCFLPVLYSKFFYIYGFLALFFHLTAGFIFGHWFIEAILGNLIFMILAEKIFKIETNGKISQEKF